MKTKSVASISDVGSVVPTVGRTFIIQTKHQHSVPCVHLVNAGPQIQIPPYEIIPPPITPRPLPNHKQAHRNAVPTHNPSPFHASHLTAVCHAQGRAPE